MPKTRRSRQKAAPPSSSGHGPARSAFERSWERAAIVWLVALDVAALVVVFDPGAVQAFDLPKSLASFALASPLAALLGLVLYRYGLATVPRTRLHLFPIAFVLASIVATAFAANTYIALFGEKARYLGLAFTLDMALLYLAIVIAFRSVEDWAVLALGLGAAFVVAGGYGLLQRLGLDPVHWTLDPLGRPIGTLGNADMLGSFLSIVIAVALAIALFAGGSRTRPVRIAAAGCAAAAFALQAVVATRGTLVGVTGAVLVLAAVHLRQRGRSRAALVQVGGGAAAVVAVLGLVLLVTPFGERARSTLSGGADVNDRLLLWDAAVRAVAQRPVIGFGPDSFAVAYPTVRQPQTATLFAPGIGESSAHDWALQTAVCLGALGLAALVATIGAFGVAAWRALTSLPVIAAATVLGAYWAQGLVSVGTVGVDWAPWVAFGAIAAAVGTSPVEINARRRTSSLAAGSVLVLAVALAFTAQSALAASHEAFAASVAMARGSATAAVTAARAAVRDDGGRADSWNDLGLSLDLTQKWKDSGDAYAEAAARAPYVSTFWSNLARSRARQALGGDISSGGANAALSAARRGALADPNDPRPNAVLGEVANAFGQYDESLRAEAKAIELYPKDPTYDAVAADAAPKHPDPAAARVLLERILASKDSAPLRLALAKVALKLNDPALARANATRALELDPSSEDARAVLRSAGATNANAAVSVTPTQVAPGGTITVRWVGIQIPTLGDWVSLAPIEYPDASYVASHLTSGSPDGTLTLVVPASASQGTYNVRLFLAFANRSSASSERIVVR